jgi:hypothetical protein
MTYEEHVHIEAHRRASKIVRPPLVKPVMGGAIFAVPVMLLSDSLLWLPGLQTLIYGILAYLVPYSLLNFQQKRFQTIFWREWHAIDRGENAVRS